MIIIAGRLHVDPEGRDRYVAECTQVVRLARAAPGCLDFALTADSVQPDRINVYERWSSDAELDAFRGSGQPDEQTAQIREAEVMRYRISAVEQA